MTESRLGRRRFLGTAAGWRIDITLTAYRLGLAFGLPPVKGGEVLA